MTEIINLEPHDPLPDGPAVILMRRFEEGDPKQDMMELIVISANQSEHNSRLLADDGTPMPWDDAEKRVIADAKEAGIERVFRIDRTAGPREREVEEHGGDRTVDMDKLQDFDDEDGVTGNDMRDMKLNAAPRKF